MSTADWLSLAWEIPDGADAPEVERWSFDGTPLFSLTFGFPAVDHAHPPLRGTWRPARLSRQQIVDAVCDHARRHAIGATG